jgi:hypothetical protein
MRVGEVVAGRSEHDFHQARDLDLAQEFGVVDQRDAAHLDVVLGGHRDPSLVSIPSSVRSNWASSARKVTR